MRILNIAWREFSATAITKGFIIGAFVVPAIMIGLIFVLGMLIANEKAPQVEGSVAVLDPTGVVTPEIRERLAPETMLEERRKKTQEIAEAMSEMGMGAGAPTAIPTDALAAETDVPILTVEPLDPEADIEEEKVALRTGPDAGGRLAIVVVDGNAVERAEGEQGYGAFDFFVRPKLDGRIVDDIRDAARESIREQRIRAAGLDPADIDALTRVSNPRAVEVTEQGERTSLGELQMMLPFAFMFLIFIPTMMGGQFLLTTTVEEKSSRVVEILLAAVSPMQLMTGKILGQLGVGLVILGIYGGLAIAALVAFSFTHLIDALTLVYVFVFFLIAYFLIASLLAAVGSAVNDMREAQSLQTPVMMLLMIPYILWMPITRSPNSTFSTVVSFVPLVNPFAMMLRVSSTEPPPAWQVLLSIAIGVASVYVALWAAAKIFRVGLLMYGKPPNFATLIQWVRMA